jgi:3-oxoacyl-[acyl-carrier-protein] synthase-1
VTHLVLSALGMVSSLGPDAVCACAAAKAGLTRTRPCEYTAFDPVSDEPEPVLGHAVSTLTDGFRGIGRLLRLAVPALQQVVEAAALLPGDMPQTGLVVVLPSGFYVAAAAVVTDEERQFEALPELGAGRLQGQCRAALPRRLCAAVDLPAPVRSLLVFEDQAGIGTALHTAIQWIARGDVKRCIVGGVDSYLEPEVLSATESLDTLKTAANPVGFMPGEGACFVLLAAEGRGARLGGVATGEIGPHQFSPKPAHGRALARAIGRLDTTPCTAVIGGLNGTEWTATQWGHALTLLPSGLRNAPLRVPVASFGEAGAAGGFFALALALRNATAPTLVWTLSPTGRAAAVRVH